MSESGISRRAFVALTGAIGAGHAYSGSANLDPEPALPASIDPTTASATAIAAAIRQRKLSSLEATSACLARIEAVNPRLNAVVQLRAESARAEARQADQELSRGKTRGPLHGVPITIKDSLDTAGIVTTGGTKGWANRVPSEDAAVVARVRAAGAIILGKTNTPELTMSYMTDNIVYGRTNNPYDQSRTPGGSSGGAAAIVAAGGSSFDIGSDTGGSIRLPSHYCGVAGLKPTSGRVPLTGHVVNWEGPWQAWTHLGPIARSVDDLILLLPIMAGPDWRDPHVVPMPLHRANLVQLPRLRVATYAENGVGKATPETVKTVTDAAQALARAGSQVTATPLPEAELTYQLFNAAFSADGGATLRRVLEKAGTTELSPFLEWVKSAKEVPSAELTDLVEQVDRLRSRLVGFMRNYDVLVCPVAPRPANPHGIDPRSDGGTTYMVPFNLLGWPVAVVRCGRSPEGLPIGVQVVGRPWTEDVVLAVAKHLEREFGGWQPTRL